MALFSIGFFLCYLCDFTDAQALQKGRFLGDIFIFLTISGICWRYPLYKYLNYLY